MEGYLIEIEGFKEREDTMDKIILEGMEFYGYHGVFAEEKSLGQKFVVSVVIYLDLKKAGQNDTLEDTVNYGEVYLETKKIVEGKSRDLIESVAESIAEKLLKRAIIEKINVRIDKPGAPISGVFKNVSVEIEREKNG